MFDMKEEKDIKNDDDIDEQIQLIKEDIEMKKDFRLPKKMFTDVPFIENVLESTMTRKFHIIVGDDCSNCRICTRVCPRGNISLDDEKPAIGDNCEFCLGCVHHCKNNVLTINDEKNSSERFINSHIKVSKIIKSNNILKNK
jgi:NAD-dependent dihydropyrimidine dehydrogenase PreA subunit